MDTNENLAIFRNTKELVAINIKYSKVMIIVLTLFLCFQWAIMVSWIIFWNFMRALDALSWVMFITWVLHLCEIIVRTTKSLDIYVNLAIQTEEWLNWLASRKEEIKIADTTPKKKKK